MALDATLYGPTADSYLATTAEATALLEASAYRAAWAAALTADAVECERKLKRAARILDTLRVAGESTTNTQALMWPREGALHPSGWIWDAFAVPRPIKIAQAELAAWLASRPSTESDPFGADASQNIASVKAGPVSVDFRDSAPMPGVDFLARFIVPLLATQGLILSSSVVRLSR